MVDRLNKQLRDKKIPFDEIRRADDTHILVRNVDSTQGSAFRDFITQQYGNYWDASSATGEPNGYILTLRQSAIATISDATMTQSVETIGRRINLLGLTEPTIQLHGRKDNEILIQLPGVGDKDLPAALRFQIDSLHPYGEDEAVYVIAGAITAIVGDQRIDVEAGYEAALAAALG